MAEDRSPGALFLHRKLRENFLWAEPRVFSRAEAWIDILMTVRFLEDPADVVIKNKRFVCGYGETLKSLETWATRWRWTKSATRRFLILLQDCGQIRFKSETQTTRITICNWAQYQKLRNTDETQMKRTRNAHETHMKPEEEGKEGKEGKEIPEGISSPAGNGSIPPCPHQEIISAYHELLPELPRILEWTAARRKALGARWKEKRERQTLEWWRCFFLDIRKSDFLMGKVNTFRADLEWVTRPKNFPKVIEGKYGPRRPGQAIEDYSFLDHLDEEDAAKCQH